MSEKIVLIDGHSILNRAFYGLPDLTNAEGLHTNAIYGFLTIMFKILEEEKPEYLTVAFDVHAPTFRHEMYDAYKGTRKPMADELRQQVPVIKEVLGAMGIKTIEQAGLEADDLLGTISRRSEERGMEVSVISGDRDPVGDMGKGVRRTADAFRKAGLSDVTLKLYPGLRHEILNEGPGRQTVYEDIWHWLEPHLPAR